MKANNSTTSNVLYVMRSVHLDGRVLVNDKRIGNTQIGDSILTDAIVNVEGTFGENCVMAWEVPAADSKTAKQYEDKINRMLSGQRLVGFDGNATDWVCDNGGVQRDVINVVSVAAKKWGLTPITK